MIFDENTPWSTEMKDVAHLSFFRLDHVVFMSKTCQTPFKDLHYSLQHDFMFRVLHAFGLPQEMIQAVRTLYRGAAPAVAACRARRTQLLPGSAGGRIAGPARDLL